MGDSIQYLILGRGRLARHLEYYLKLQGHQISLWSREKGAGISEELSAKKGSAVKALIVVSDQAIPQMIDSCLRYFPCEDVCHFSGSCFDSRVLGAHPLMSFGAELYSQEVYAEIPFIVDQPAAQFSKIFPTLENPVHHLAPELKPLYHAWCSMSLNFTQYLWAETFETFEKNLGLPRDVLVPSLKQLFENMAQLYRSPRDFMTGPMIRGDQEVVLRHQQVLENHPYLKVYQAFAQSMAKGVQ